MGLKVHKYSWSRIVNNYYSDTKFTVIELLFIVGLLAFSVLEIYKYFL